MSERLRIGLGSFDGYLYLVWCCSGLLYQKSRTTQDLFGSSNESQASMTRKIDQASSFSVSGALKQREFVSVRANMSTRSQDVDISGIC